MNLTTSNGTAVAGVNYTPVNQVLNFAAGQNSQTVMIPVTNTGSSSSGLTVNLARAAPDQTPLWAASRRRRW